MPAIANNMTYEKVKELQQYSWEDKELDERVEAGIEIPFCRDAIKLDLGTNREMKIPDPTLIFEKQIQLHLGGVSVFIEHIGGDHSPDSNLIYIPEEKALFLGDSLYANMYATKWHYTIEKMTKLLEKIEQYVADYFFLSHHPAPLNREEFSSFATLLKTSAELTDKHVGKLEAIKEDMSRTFGRDLTEEDIEIIEYFANGYTIKKLK